MELNSRISLKALKVWKQTGLIISGILVLFADIISLLTYFFDLSKWSYFLSWGMVLIVFIVSVFVLPALRWKWWRYEVRENEIEIQRGLIVIKRTLVPMIRVQHVDTKQGPLMRRNKLASVEISTAATVHEIPALDWEEAENLRKYIAQMVMLVKEDV